MLPGRDRGGTASDERAGVGHRADDRAPGRDGFERGDGDTRGDRQHERAVGQHLGAARECGDRVGRLHREHQHLGVARGPRRVAHDAHAGQPRLEGVVTVGVDLGDRELLGFPAAVEQADRERFAHATAAHECQTHPLQANRDRERRMPTSPDHERDRWAEPEERSVPPRTSPSGAVLLHLGPGP